ncbi:MAG: ribonuclease HI [Phycisphaerales bacterium]
MPVSKPQSTKEPTDRPRVELFTDGACSGNPGPGGWAFMLKHAASGSQKEGSGGDPATTNNRMELQAVIEGLKALTRPSEVDLYSDSKYVLDGLESWIKGWKKNGWKTKAKQPVKNAELWRELDELRNQHTVRFHWVKGHSSHAENERCDELAVAARDAAALQARS